MVRLREINAKAHFAFAPDSTLIATVTSAGTINDDFSDDAAICLYDPSFDETIGEIFTLKPIKSESLSEKCVSIAWGGVDAKIIATANESAAITLYTPNLEVLQTVTTHTGLVRCLDWSNVQRNLLASAGTKGEFYIHDTSKTPIVSTPYRSTRLDEIISIAWNNKAGHIIALGGRGGALSVWDLRKKSELLHIPTRFPVTSIAWHPTEPTLLIVTSGDDLNPVVQTWDLRHSNAPRAVLSGHEKAVLNVAWCAEDPELLITAGADNRTLIWNPVRAEIVAELPASSQQVQQVAWSRKQPSIIANASLDGKISLYTLQDTTAPASTEAIIDETPAGDDFFDSIPKNFQAQIASFTLKQTPKWLSNPIGAKFAFNKLVQISGTRVELRTSQLEAVLSDIAKEIQAIDDRDVRELCETAKNEASDEEKQEWEAIQALTNAEPQSSLMQHLGIAPETIIPLELGQSTDDDVFEGIGQVNGVSDTSKFTITDASASATDASITKSIIAGNFDAAIDLCLKEDRMADAFALAASAGESTQRRVQKAYFDKASVPYARLLSCVVNKDLDVIVQNANLQNWKDVISILCTYAKTDFSELCEQLGKRLEEEDIAAATMCYVAGHKLEHLVRIWDQREAKAVEARLIDASDSPFNIHSTHLGKLMKKVAIYRKVSGFKDAESKSGSAFALAPLYERYIEFASLLASEGDLVSAREYLGLVPAAFPGLSAIRTRLEPKVVKAAVQGTPRKPTGLRQVYTQPQADTYQQTAYPAQAAYSAPAQSAQSVYAPPQPVQQVNVPVVPAPRPGPYTPAASQAVGQPNPYAPVVTQQPQAPVVSHNPVATVYAPQQRSNIHNGYTQQQNFGPPQGRSTSNGPTMLPAAQRKDITPWNDAPDIPLPAPRRATPSITTRSAIASPFPNLPSPTLQGFGAPAPPPGPPKARSPAPPKAAQPFQPPPQKQSQPSQYAPSQIAQPPQQAFPPPQQQPQQQQQPFQPPPVAQPVAFAPPPKATTKLVAKPPASPVIKSPTIGRGVALSREPSRPSTPEAQPAPAPTYPPGDRSHISPADQVIVDILSNELARLRQVAAEKYRRPLEDSHRRLQILFDQLNNSLLSPTALSQVHTLATSIGKADWQSAYATQLELTSSGEVREWISATKALIVIGKNTT